MMPSFKTTFVKVAPPAAALRASLIFASAIADVNGHGRWPSHWLMLSVTRAARAGASSRAGKRVVSAFGSLCYAAGLGAARFIAGNFDQKEHRT